MLHSKRKSLAGVLLFLGLISSSAASEYTNFFGTKLVSIPAGSFEMGACKLTKGMQQENRKRTFLGLPPVDLGCSSPDPKVNDNETPIRTVTVNPFMMATTPVTAGQYKKYLDAIGETNSKDDWGLYNEEFQRLNSFGDDAPVVQVSWHEAQDFLRWLNENKPKDDPYIYRLPSEAEWEYACRAGGKQRYCGSDDAHDVGWVNRDGIQYQQLVGSKEPNAWGLYDMSGSIWQWVEDVYHDSYIGAPSDGRAWIGLGTNDEDILQKEIDAINKSVAEGKMKKIEAALITERMRFDAGIKERSTSQLKSENSAARVLRGGSWRFTADFARATYRLAGEPGNWYYGNGFRIAASLP